MTLSLRDIFVPTERNEMVPYALSPSAFLLYLLIVLASFVSPAYLRQLELADLSAPTGFTPGQMIALTNQSRATAGLPALAENTLLDSVAEEKAGDIFNKQYFAHVSPSGETPWDFLHQSGYVYTAAGENLALDYPSAEDTHDALMNSPTHRANILGALYTQIGIAVEEGVYDGHPSIIVVEYFGNPKTPAAAKPASSAPSKPAPMAAKKPAAPAAKPIPVVTKATPTITPPVEVPSVISQPTKTAGTAPATAAAPKEVLGAEAPQSPGSLMLSRTLAAFSDSGKFVADAAILVILIAVAFLITRTGSLPLEIAMKAIVFVAVLGNIALFAPTLISPRVSSAAFSIVNVAQDK